VPTRQKLRSQETKQAILTAARNMFSDRGFNAVTMRDIAKEAGCSHTTIYIYFQDKEELLHDLSMPPLIELKQRLEHLASRSEVPPESNLKEISMEFIRFCLLNKSLYSMFLITKGTRVDDAEPELPINKLRIELFQQIGKGLQTCLQLKSDDDRLLTFNRIYFFMLHGIVSTYSHSEESLPDMMNRLSSTFEEAFEALLIGFTSKTANGG
jgi:AcrR family transcriptional regulator